MKRIIFAILTIALIAGGSFAQIRPRPAPFLGRFTTVNTPNCTLKGQFFYDTTLFTYKTCTATGTPGTWIPDIPSPASWDGTTYKWNNTAANSEVTMEFKPDTATGRFRVGDFTTTPTTYIDLQKATEAIVLVAGGGVVISAPIANINSGTGGGFLANGSTAKIGDTLSAANATTISIDDSSRTISANSGSGTTSIGDVLNTGNNTTFVLDDSAQTFTFGNHGSPSLTVGTTIDVGASLFRIGLNSGLQVKDVGTHYLGFVPGSTLTADRSLTFTTGDTSRTINVSGGNLTLGGAFTTVGSDPITLSSTAPTSVTLPTAGTLVTLTGSESLTNKKLGSLTNNGFVKTSAGDGTLSVDTNTYLNAATNSTQTGYFGDIKLFDDVTPSHYLAITEGDNLTADRILTVKVNDAARTVDLGGNLTTAGALTTSGAFALTLTQTAGTNVTLPTSGTLATLAGTEALTGKSINGLTVSTSTGTLTVANGSTLATSGANSLTLTTSGATNVTLPTAGTLSTLAGTESLTNKTVTYTAGTTGVAPINLTSGTNLTTPAAGAVEYDGNCAYFSRAASQRACITTEQYVSNTSDTTLNSDANPQSVFAAANDVLTATASTTYFVDCRYDLTTGGTTHTTSTLFGGTATLTSISYWARLYSGTDGTISTTAPSVLRVAVGTATVLNATSTATATNIELRGIIRVNGAGTLIPQIQFSANPTGTNLGKTNSYCRLTPVGLNTAASVGPWN